MKTSGNGVFYVATGEKHRVMTCRAIESLKKTNPAIAVSVFTDKPEDFASVRNSLDAIHLFTEPAHNYRDKLWGFVRAPYERCVFLDSDTVVVGDISELFELLERFDFAAAHAPGRSGARIHDYEDKSIPSSFVQFNTGVVCFRRTPAVLAAFEEWRRIYGENPRHRHDQPSLRAALYESQLSLYVLPPEYNFLEGCAYFSGPVKIVHSAESPEHLRVLEQAINANTGSRVILPSGEMDFHPTARGTASTPSGTADVTEGEHHLFIIWEHARAKQEDIIEDLRQRFVICNTLEVAWSPERVSSNYTRFYGTQLPPGSEKETHCGTGPFLAVIVYDRAPRYQMRRTSKGMKSVNANTFDAKMQYRQWTGGGHRIHGTNSLLETRHDVALLLGNNWRDEFITSPEWSGEIIPLHRDLSGAAGWASLAEFFGVLNSVLRYVVLRNFEMLPDQHATELHGDIDLLTDAYDDLVYIANGEKVFHEKHRVHYQVPIGGELVPFDFRFVGDDYYDRRWEEDILSRREFCDRGFYVPTPKDYFYSLLYHAIVHKRAIAADYPPKLRVLAVGAEVSCKAHLDSGNPCLMRSVMEPYLEANHYTLPRPVDKSVYYNEANLEGRVALEAVCQGLPMVESAECLVSARLLAEIEGRKYFSYVYLPANASFVLKQATDDLAWREAKILKRLSGPSFPRVISAAQNEGHSLVKLEKIEGKPLQRVAKEISGSRRRLAQFLADCLAILSALQKAQITHRDINMDNVIVRDGKPVLIDFGWALAPGHACLTPDGLGRDAHPSDGTFCDVFSMGKLFEKLLPATDEQARKLVAMMTSTNAEERIVHVPALQNLLAELIPMETDAAALFQAGGRTDAVLGDGAAPELRLPPGYQNAIGGGDYVAVGNEFLGHFIKTGGLQPNARVLDIGCGFGRIAHALTRHIRGEGTYDGIDIMAEEIDWCQKHLTPRNPNFRFHHADVRNRHYNPAGRFEAADYHFPFADGSFDFIILTSVFTHMMPRDLRHYLEEISRLLAPGGTAFVTFFIYRDSSLRAVLNRFPVAAGLCRCQDAKNPEAAIAYHEDFLRGLLRDTGLASAGPFLYGEWDGRKDGFSYQDVVLLKKADKPETAATESAPASAATSAEAGKFFSHGLELFESGKYQEAAQAIQSAAQLAPHDAGVLVHLVAVLVQMDRLIEAEIVAGTALAIHPSCLEAWQFLAALHQNRSKFKEAAGALTQVLRLGGKNGELLEQLAQCYDAAGDKVRAELARKEAQELALQKPGEESVPIVANTETTQSGGEAIETPSRATPNDAKLAPGMVPVSESPSTEAAKGVSPEAVHPATEFVVPLLLARRRFSAPPGVSIVIPNFNRGDLSLACLASLARVKSPVPFEVVFVDNGSTDGSVEFVRRWQKQSSYSIRIVENSTNLGFAKACNQGAAAAGRDVLLFLNNDTEAKMDFLSQPLELLQSPAIGIVGIKLLYPDGLIQHAGIAFDGQKVGHHIYASNPADFSPANRTRELQAVTGACLFIPRKLFNEVGGFDEAYVNGHEDIDLCCKVRVTGSRIVYFPGVHIVHHESQSAGRLDKALDNRRLFQARWGNKMVEDLSKWHALPKNWLAAKSFQSKFDLPAQLGIAIKIGVPDRSHRNWGDIFFAESLAKELDSLGHRSAIHYLNEWNLEDRQIQVVIHVKGLSRYELKPYHFNVLWVINHPELHTVEEMNRYDLVLVASRKYCGKIRSSLTVPVHYVAQAADVRYVGRTKEAAGGQEIDVLFVGNNYEAKHGRCRRIIADLLKIKPAGTVKVVGKDWTGYVPEEWILSEFIAPDALPELYGRAKIVLNDHQETMRQQGFVNNRVFDLAQLRAFQISNSVAGLEEFGVPSYQTRSELKALLESYLSDATARTDVTERVFEACRQFTFAERAREISRLIRATAQKIPPHHHCNICGHTGFDFLAMGARLAVRCPKCDSLERHRALWFLLERDEVLRPGVAVLEIAPLNNRIFRQQVEAKGAVYVSVDKWRHGNPLDRRDTSFIDYAMDLCDLKFPAQTFDVVLMQHVIEEVPDDQKAFAEIARVLKPAGTAILEVPHHRTAPATDDYGEARKFGNVRSYGVDFYERLAKSFEWRQEHTIDGVIFSVLKPQGQPPPAAFPVLLDHPAFKPETFAGRFRDAIHHLQRHGFEPLTAAQAANCARGVVHYPRACWLTLDDGSRQDVEVALPILNETGYRATSFLIPDKITATSRELWQKVPSATLEIQSHSLSHRQVCVSGKVVDVYRQQYRYVNLVAPGTPAGHPIFEFRSGLAARRFIPTPAIVEFCLAFYQQHGELGETEYLGALQTALQQEFPTDRGTLESDQEFAARLEQEIGGAKSALQKEFRRPIFALAFPWGQYCAESLTVARRHYAVAAGVLPSRPNQVLRPFELERIEIPGAAFQEFRRAIYSCRPWQPVTFKGAPEVCVLMTTYNRRHTLADSIQSVVDQIFNDWNLILVNDGGENVADIVVQFNDPRIHYLDRPHAGKCAALNAAIRESKSRYIAYLDDDDRFLPNHLEVLISYLHRHPESRFVHSMAEEVSTVPAEGGVWREHSRGIRYGVPVKLSALRFNNYIPNLCAVHARELFDTAGRFDETLDVLIDWDMYRRLAVVSAPQFVNVKTAEYYRRVTPENRAVGQITGLYATDPVRYYRNRLRVIRKAGYEHLQSAKEAVVVLVLTEESRDDIAGLRHYAQIKAQCPVDLVVLAACSLDERSIFPIRLAEMLGALVIWDEEKIGAEAMLAAYLQQPWGRKNLIFWSNGELKLAQVQDGLAAAGAVQDFRSNDEQVKSATTAVKHSPGLSILLDPQGSPAYLGRCVEHVARFSPVARAFEMLVVDHGLDATGQELLARLAAKYSWLVVVRPPAGLSTVAAKNAGSRVAKHDYLVFLDALVAVQSGWAEPVMSVLERYPEIAMVGSKGVFSDGTTVHAGVLIMQGEAGAGSLTYLMTQHRRPFHQAEAMRHQECRALMRGCFVVRRQALLDAGGFDEELGLGYEDLDLCVRLAQAGAKIVLEPASVVVYGDTNLVLDGRGMAKMQRQFSEKWRDKLQPDVIRGADGKPQAVGRTAVRGAGERRPARPTGSDNPTPRDSVPVVSIVIPVWNQLALTQQCLDRIGQNPPAANYEVIVVDNGSTDGSGAWLGGRQRSGAVRLIVNPKNAGFAVACNQGARVARGRYVLFLNNDTEPRAGWLDALLDTAERDPAVAAVGSRLLYPNGTVQHAGVGMIDDQRNHDPLQARNLGVGLSADAPDVNQVREFQALTAACLLVRTAALAAVGGFDEGYWNGYEDIDLCFKLREQGGRLVYQPASVVIHHESKSGAERFSRAGANIKRLHARWLGRIKPDFILGADGVIAKSESGGIAPYVAGVTPATPRGGRAGADDEKRTGPAAENLAETQSLVNGAGLEPAGAVSIIILAHNQLKHTRRCLDSVVANTDAAFELIVVNNGSTDGTAGYLSEQQQRQANLRVITNRQNRGFSAGNNQALAVAQGAHVVLLNNDTVVPRNWLGAMLDVLKAHPASGIVGPRSNRVSGPQKIDEVGYQSLEDMGAFAASWAEEHAGQSRRSNRVVGFCLLARRSVVDRIGGLDEQFGSGNFEDDDFCMRARLAGFESRIADAAFVHHVGSATFTGAGIDYRSAMLTNWNLFKRKWGIPAETQPERGYPTPDLLPPGMALKVPLPDLAARHTVSPDGRTWTERVVEAKTPTITREGSPQPWQAVAGGLAEAREKLRQKNHADAWAATVAAIQSRSFHPEAYLLLAEIAQAAGDGASAQRCVQYVQKTAPKFRPNDPLLKVKFRGGAQPEWLVLPANAEPVGQKTGPVGSRVADSRQLAESAVRN